MGRSGTKFLASVLSRSSQASVFHEEIGDREFWLLSWYLDKENYSKPFLLNQKMILEKRSDSRILIDVNSGLQNSADVLKEVFPGARIFHLVRDPRKVIPSIYNRRSDKRIHLVPKTRNEFEKWLNYTKLEQVCWNWNDTTTRLLKSDLELIQFEKLISDYQYFKNSLTDKIGISDINEHTWDMIRNSKVNSTKPKWYRYLYSHLKRKDFVSEHLPRFEEWQTFQQKVLFDICGETMEKLGYE